MQPARESLGPVVRRGRVQDLRREALRVGEGRADEGREWLAGVARTRQNYPKSPASLASRRRDLGGGGGEAGRVHNGGEALERSHPRAAIKRPLIEKVDDI